MAVTLAEAKNNAQTDYDPFVIDEFRKESALLDELVFDDAVNPSGGGATMTYGYRRLVTQPTAATRALNTEYAPQNVTTEQFTTNLTVLGGSFEIDRVIARIGKTGSDAVTLNMVRKIKAAKTLFQDLVINGDVATDPNAFDGLDKALTGSSTEFRAGATTDWSALNTSEARLGALDALDEFLTLLDGSPTLLLGNQQALARVRSIVRGSGMYVQNPVDGLVGAGGRPITRETYGGLTLVDAGAKAGSNDPIIPTAANGTTSLYAVRIGMDGFHGVTTVGSQMVLVNLPDFSSAGAVKKGEVELGPVSVALKATKAAAVFRNLKVR